MVRYLTLFIFLIQLSCTDYNYKPPMYISLGTIEVRGMYPKYNCSGFEKDVLYSFRKCMSKSENESLFKEEDCVRWAKQTWCATDDTR